VLSVDDISNSAEESYLYGFLVLTVSMINHVINC